MGAEELPSADNLSQEIIEINRGYGDVSHGFLTYQLRPDNSLAVTHLDEYREKVVGKETFQLAPHVATQARRMLWRLRPSTLEGQGLTRDEFRPVGCQRRGPHDFGRLAIVFIDEGEDAGVSDDQLGVFELPYRASCDTPHASEARDLVERVLRSFPPSRVAAEFLKLS